MKWFPLGLWTVVQASCLVCQVDAGLLRGLQADDDDDDENPCAVPLEDVVLEQSDRTLKPSYLAACLRSLPVLPTEAMVQHITHLRDIFRDYDCFYDLANNASDSDPMSFNGPGSEINYTLFAGPAEGQVNLSRELTDLATVVAKDGASVHTFHDIQTIFNKAYDGHIGLGGLGDGPLGQFTDTFLFVFPANVSNGLSLQSWDPSYNEDGVLQIAVVFQNKDEERKEERVRSINGMTPFQWYLNLVSNPAWGDLWTFQSVGARMNKAFERFAVSEMSFLDLDTNGFELRGQNALPPDVLGDAFEVVFVSNRTEVFVVGANLNTPDDDGTASSNYAALNNNATGGIYPSGAPFANYEVALGRIANATRTDVQSNGPKVLHHHHQQQPPALHEEEGANFQFDDYFTAPDADNNTNLIRVGAYKVTDDYALFKLWDFNIFPAQKSNRSEGQFVIPEMWSNFTRASKAKNVKKAIIDISRNGGGVPESGFMLAASMYPFVPFRFLQNEADVTYNRAMHYYNTVVRPLVYNELGEEIDNLSDAQLKEKLDDLVNNNIGVRLMAIGQALIEYCAAATGVTKERCADPCDGLCEFVNVSDAFAMAPTADGLRTVLNAFYPDSALYSYTPLKVLGEGFDPDQIRTLVRGGVSQNLTNRYGNYDMEQHNEAVKRSIANEWMFDEYVLLGDGTGGSTTMFFATTAMNLWNYRAQWNNGSNPITPLASVSFGGTNLPRDTNVANYPAWVQTPNIGTPYIGAGMLSMLELLMPGSSDTNQKLSAANEVYQTTLVRPPYFAAILPRMPVVNFYSNFMGNDALPIQYIKIFSDRHFHIPQIYTKLLDDSGEGDGSDLETLYSRVVKVTASASDADNGPPNNPPDIVVAVVDLTQPVAPGINVAASWVSLRQNFPRRRFCLLGLRGTMSANDPNAIPNEFFVDDNTVYHRVTMDRGNPFYLSDWADLCGVGSYRGIATAFPIYVGVKDQLVLASLSYFTKRIEAYGGTVMREDGGRGMDWVAPLNKNFY